MATVTYDKRSTALIVIDPYNDFLSEGGKLWDKLKGVAEANNCVPHMLQVLSDSAIVSANAASNALKSRWISAL
jgi:hypothetical protein